MNKQEIIEEFKKLGYKYFSDNNLTCFRKVRPNHGLLTILFTNIADDDCYIHSYDLFGKPIGLSIREAELAIEFAKTFKEENNGER